MLRLHSILRLACIAVLPAALSGCAGALIAGGLAAAGGAGYAAGDERGIEGNITDFNIKNNIEGAWYRANPLYMNSFVATVYDRDVLLTGHAAEPEMKRQAVEVASRVPGVRHIYDHIGVGPPGTWDVAKDTWITTELRSKLMLERGIRSGNYKVETSDGSVYLMGTARSQEELNKATYLARYIPGVRRVVSYVSIRTGMPVAQETGPASPLPPESPSSYSPPPSAAPGSSAPIQVQRL